MSGPQKGEYVRRPDLDWHGPAIVCTCPMCEMSHTRIMQSRVFKNGLCLLQLTCPACGRKETYAPASHP